MGNTPISKNQEVYTDRYGPRPDVQQPQDPYADTVDYEEQLQNEFALNESWDPGPENAAAYRQIEDGTPNSPYPGAENELFGDMNDEQLVQSGQAMATRNNAEELSEFEKARVQLNGLLTEIEDSSIPASKKTSLIQKINELKNKLEAGDSAGLEAAEGVMDEARELIEEHPPIASRLASQFIEVGIDCTDEQIKKALRNAGLSEEELSRIQLPANTENSEALISFFKEIDPNFAQMFETAPYGKDAMNRASTLLRVTLNLRQAPEMEKVANTLDTAVTVTWNTEDFVGRVSGDWANEKRQAMEGLSRLVTTGEGLEEIHNNLWSGHNDVDRRHHVWNDIIRSGTSYIFEAAGRNPYLLRRYLKMIPEQILRDLRDVVIAHSGELGEKHAGDLFTSQETHDILDWAISGGTPPDVLKDDLPTGEAS